MQFLHPIYILAILIALTVHEAAHAFVSNRLGDPTAKMLGRLTLNPIAHLDPMGTLLFFLVGFGWGKPVPVDPRHFTHPKRDNALVALAGPVSNLVLAFLAFIGLTALSSQLSVLNTDASVWNLLNVEVSGSITQTFFLQFFAYSLLVNLALMAFNLLPIAPLDGSKVLAGFISYHLEDAYENFMRNGPFILLGLLVAERLLNVPFLSVWVSFFMENALRLMEAIIP